MTLNYKCGYCGKEFAREKTLAVHVCEKKRRHLSRGEKHVQAALIAYQKFYQIAQRATKAKTFEEFVDSPYYNAFIKFGSFLSNANPIYPEQYIEWVIKSGVKLDHWCREEMYYVYVLDLIKKEPAEVALQRTISTMMAWADNNDSHWNHYFKYVSLNRAVYDIKDGKISPWLVLNCDSGRTMLAKLNDEQLGIIFTVMDPEYWARRFRTYPADMDLVKSVVAEGKL
jgi:DNA-directed RNA polymerase subunit RPC12/RpoP